MGDYSQAIKENLKEINHYIKETEIYIPAFFIYSKAIKYYIKPTHSIINKIGIFT